MAKVQKIISKSGEEVHFMYLPVNVVKELDLKKGDELHVQINVDADSDKPYMAVMKSD